MKRTGGLFVFLLSYAAFPASSAGPTYCGDVAPLLVAHCAVCHVAGRIAASVQLLSYKDARPWAKAIREKVLLRQMPPWPPDQSRSVRFRNDARLSERDIATIAGWVDSGATEGGPCDPASQAVTAQGWLHPHGKPPDAVVQLPEADLPESGEIPYVVRLVKVPFPQDKWINAIQVRPSNAAVLHHMAVTELEADPRLGGGDLNPLMQLAREAGFENDLIGMRPAVTLPGSSGTNDMLAIYTPGTSFESYPQGTAKLLKGGGNYQLDCNLHYQTTGKSEKDQTSIGFWFADEPPKHQLFRVNGAAESLIANGRELLLDTPGQKAAEGNSVAIPPIPPGAVDYELSGMTAYPAAVTIYQFHPHAHLRATSFAYVVVYPDGREQSVLSVPRYDFHWQLAYDLETPLELPAGSKLVVTARYDNSKNNPYNPAPDKAVHFWESGNQSWDEMFTPFVQFAVSAEGAARQLEIVETTGRLRKTKMGDWMLVDACNPTVSRTQATSASALAAARARPAGDRIYRLLGVRFFDPEKWAEERVAVKGVLITTSGENRINVTSLQALAPDR